jgi:hypothetical protein
MLMDRRRGLIAVSLFFDQPDNHDITAPLFPMFIVVAKTCVSGSQQVMSQYMQGENEQFRTDTSAFRREPLGSLN